MRSLSIAKNFFRNLFRRRQIDAELDDEIRSTVEMLADQKIKGGMPPEEARRAARIEIGGVEQVKESVRAARVGAWFDTLLKNSRFGIRVLRKFPGFTAVAVLTLALGIGATTAIFTAAYATLLAPLPYPQPGRLVNVWSSLQGHRTWVSVGDFTDWKRQNAAFENLDALSTDDFNVATTQRPEFVQGVEVTPGYYRTLGARFFLGRNFLPEEAEPGKDRVVILTHQLWQRLGANPQILGRTLQINSEPYTVVGVFAPGVADRWDWKLAVPLVFTPEEQVDRDSHYLFVTGRLKPGVTIQQARDEMGALAETEAKNYPKSDQGWGVLVEPFKNDFLAADRRLTLWLLLGAVGFLLLIACVNVANLVLARGIVRQKEVAIRCSLGAKPGAVFAQFLTESLVLAIIGGLLGLAVGYAMLRGLVATLPLDTLPAEANLSLNVPVLLFMLAVTTIAGVLFGCAPAWHASRVDPAEVLKEGGHSGTNVGRRRLRRALVVAEFALALPLLTGAGLTIHSFWNLTHVDLGVHTDHLLVFYLEPPSLLKNPAQIDPYYHRILASINAVPGVSNAAAMTYLPLGGVHYEMPFTIAGRPAYANPSLRPSADLQEVTPDYFRTFGIRIVEGRAFTDADNRSSFRVAMVNDTFARRFLSGVDPLDERLVMEQVIPDAVQNGPAVAWQIVGVFHTVKSRGAREDNPEIATPFWQEATPIAGIGVRTAEDPAAMIKSIAAAVNDVDPQAALYEPRTMEQVHDEALANDRFTVILFASFAVIALLLAALGIHGVMAFSVAQRSHEIALRVALGATRNGVVALILKEGLGLACAGLSLGLIGAYLVGRAVRSILFDVGSIDSSTLVAAGLVLVSAAFLACYLPARRAAGVDPMVALRHE